MKKINEISLITRCVIADDRDAFSELVEAYQMKVRRFLLHLTMGNEALADDLAQETFIKAYMAIRSFRGLSSFSTWLYRIAYNEFCSARRSHFNQTVDVDSVSPAEMPRDDYASRSDNSMDIVTMLKPLSEIERTIITMFYIEDLPIKKISSVLSIPAGTVKSHLHRAKDKIAKNLSQEL